MRSRNCLNRCAALLAILFALVSSVAAAENRDGIAVIIGNRTYTGTTPAVAFAHNDARAMKTFVIQRLGYRPGNVIDLRDATLAQLREVFGSETTHKGKLHDWVRAGKSSVIVYYSGHGVPGLEDGKSYLLPADGDPNRAEISGYSIDLLLRNLSRLKASSVTVYLDSCFSGASQGGPLVHQASGLAVTPRAPRPPAGIVVLAAAADDQLASWDERKRHGLFTGYLLDALAGAADRKVYGDEDGRVTLGEVRNYLDDEMTYQARRLYGRDQRATAIGDPETVLATLRTAEPAIGAVRPRERNVLENDVASQKRFRPGETFKDCPMCPTMVAVPPGTFAMGSPDDEKGREDSEGPAHRVAIGRALAVGKFEVTFAEWDACRADGGCQGHRPDDHDRGRGRHPVSDVSWGDAQAYVRWLAAKTGRPYRLLSEAEWEYAARAGMAAPNPWTRHPDGACMFANVRDFSGERERMSLEGPFPCDDGYAEAAPVGSYQVNRFGLNDMLGNVAEWVADCWRPDHRGAFRDGAARIGDTCKKRVVRGGSWRSRPDAVRVAYRRAAAADSRDDAIGFRVVRSLDDEFGVGHRVRDDRRGAAIVHVVRGAPVARNLPPPGVIRRPLLRRRPARRPLRYWR